MSHVVSVKTTIKDLDVLIDALILMGYSVNKNDKTITYWGGKNADVDFSFHAGNNNQHAGFKKNSNGEFELVGDSMWSIMQDRDFQQELKQQCAFTKIKKTCTQHGINISTVNKMSNGNLKIVATHGGF